MTHYAKFSQARMRAKSAVGPLLMLGLVAQGGCGDRASQATGDWCVAGTTFRGVTPYAVLRLREDESIEMVITESATSPEKHGYGRWSPTTREWRIGGGRPPEMQSGTFTVNAESGSIALTTRNERPFRTFTRAACETALAHVTSRFADGARRYRADREGPPPTAPVLMAPVDGKPWTGDWCTITVDNNGRYNEGVIRLRGDGTMETSWGPGNQIWRYQGTYDWATKRWSIGGTYDQRPGTLRMSADGRVLTRFEPNGPGYSYTRFDCLDITASHPGEMSR